MHTVAGALNAGGKLPLAFFAAQTENIQSIRAAKHGKYPVQHTTDGFTPGSDPGKIMTFFTCLLDRGWFRVYDEKVPAASAAG